MVTIAELRSVVPNCVPFLHWNNVDDLVRVGRLFVIGWFSVSSLRQRESRGGLLGSVLGITYGREGKEVGIHRERGDLGPWCRLPWGLSDHAGHSEAGVAHLYERGPSPPCLPIPGAVALLSKCIPTERWQLKATHWGHSAAKEISPSVLKGISLSH